LSYAPSSRPPRGTQQSASGSGESIHVIPKVKTRPFRALT
jgi:hypothetical protein